MQYKGVYDGKEISYKGYIESLGEYPSAKADGYKVWFGQTDYGFIYVCYNENDTENALVLSDKYLVSVFRFSKSFRNCEEAQKVAGVRFSRQIDLPWFALGRIIYEAILLKQDTKKKSYKYIEDAKEIVSHLEPPINNLFSL